MDVPLKFERGRYVTIRQEREHIVEVLCSLPGSNQGKLRLKVVADNLHSDSRPSQIRPH